MIKINKNLLWVFGTAILILFIGFLLLSYGGRIFLGLSSYLQKPDPYKNSIILFYGSGCDHCDTIDKFIESNKIEDKVEFIRLEVFDSEVNANILADKAQICGLDYNQIGVPFLWDGINKKCILGYVDVIDFFKDRISKKL